MVPLVGLVASEVLDLVGACFVVADDVGCVDGDVGASVGF